MKGLLTRGKRVNYVRVDHAVTGGILQWCLTCCQDTEHAVLEPGNLVMCSLCKTVYTK